MSLIPSRRGKYYTGVSLDHEVTAYVNQIAEQMGWNRSLTINFIVREHAHQHGNDLVVRKANRTVAREAKSK